MKFKGALFLLGLVLLIGSQACDENTCDYRTNVLTEVPSPNGKLKAVIFKVQLDEGPGRQGNCQGSLAVYESLSILGKDEKVPEDIKKGTPRKGNAVPYNENLRARWVSDNELSVTGRLVNSPDLVQTVNGVTVRYEMDPAQK